MAHNVVCRLKLNRWKRQRAKGVAGRAVFYRCSRCGEERYDSDAQVPPIARISRA